MKIEQNKTKVIDFRFGKIGFFASYSVDGLGWFRIFGIGLHWKDTTKHRLYFSERNGYSKAVNIGRYRISILK